MGIRRVDGGVWALWNPACAASHGRVGLDQKGPVDP